MAESKKTKKVEESRLNVIRVEAEFCVPQADLRLREMLDIERAVVDAVATLEAEHERELSVSDEVRCMSDLREPVIGELQRGVRELEVELTEAEQLDAGKDAAIALHAQRRLEELKKSITVTLKALCDRYEERIAAQLLRTDRGTAIVPVVVVAVPSNEGAGMADEIRCDTGEVFNTRKMSADERQTRFA